jgi:hemin uptake protein HemP
MGWIRRSSAGHGVPQLRRYAALVRLAAPVAIINANAYHYQMDRVSLPPPDTSRSRRSSSVELTPRRIRSRELFGASREVRIDHEGVEYRLSRTRQGKLILTK